MTPSVQSPAWASARIPTWTSRGDGERAARVSPLLPDATGRSLLKKCLAILRVHGHRFRPHRWIAYFPPQLRLTSGVWRDRHRRVKRRRCSVSRARLEAFSDGVMAVAITLLALNLGVQGPGHGPVLELIAKQWPAFAAYVVSFFIIGIIWVNHHSLLQNIAHVDRPLLFISLTLLLFVVMIPFAKAARPRELTSGDTNPPVLT